jgi:hypothetical protein
MKVMFIRCEVLGLLHEERRKDGRTDGQKAIATLISKRFQLFVADASAWHCFHFLPFTVVARHSER